MVCFLSEARSSGLTRAATGPTWAPRSGRSKTRSARLGGAAPSPEAKYKAKQVVGAFAMRAGDSMAAGFVRIGARTAMSARDFIATNVALALVWVGLAVSAVASVVVLLWISRTMLRHTRQGSSQSALAASAVVLLATWALSFPAPRLAAFGLYLFTSLFGAAMISALEILAGLRRTPEAPAAARSATV